MDEVPREETLNPPVEIVERKGIGHPDTLCDGLAEAVSRRLCEVYFRETGFVQHHNVDKVTLVAGEARVEPGGGEQLSPIYVLIAGRATHTVEGTPLPVEEIARRAARDFLTDHFGSVGRRGFEIDVRLGDSAVNLQSLFEGDVPRANDTSVGIGYAPLSPLERTVRSLEPRVHGEIDAAGKDVKIMGYRQGDSVRLVVAVAVRADRISDLDDYERVCGRVEELALSHAAQYLPSTPAVAVNAADRPDRGEVYLTATGLSAEMGDDGSVGRGNRANGLITPLRPTSMEAVCGKNPINHTGKVYNLLALDLSRTLHRQTGEPVMIALGSRIGTPLNQPDFARVRTSSSERGRIRDTVERGLNSLTGRDEPSALGTYPFFQPEGDQPG